jgi:hypothetical protein
MKSGPRSRSLNTNFPQPVLLASSGRAAEIEPVGLQRHPLCLHNGRDSRGFSRELGFGEQGEPRQLSCG